MKIENKPDIVGDIHNLPFRDKVFANSIADPPYSDAFAKELYNTPPLKSTQWVKEMVRVTKAGGLVCIMHNYPMAQPKNCKYECIVYCAPTRLAAAVTSKKQDKRAITKICFLKLPTACIWFT